MSYYLTVELQTTPTRVHTHTVLPAVLQKPTSSHGSNDIHSIARPPQECSAHNQAACVCCLLYTDLNSI